MHHISQRDTRDAGSLCLCKLVEHLGYRAALIGRATASATFVFGLLDFFVGFEEAAAESAPWSHGHSFVLAHGYDVSFEVAAGGAPFALVDAELGQGVIAGVLVGFADDPGRGVADSQVEDLPCGDEMVQRLHDLWDGSCEIPPMDVQYINVGRLQVLQASLDGNPQALGVITLVVGFDVLLELEAGGVLGSNDHLIAVPAFGHPLTDPGLTLPGLVVVGGVEKVAAGLVEMVEDSMALLLVALAHRFLPVLTESHGSQT